MAKPDLKSYRDRNVAFRTYENGGGSAYLDSLGPLTPMPKRR